MKIAVASGKGGTGKTTVAVNLALVSGENVRILDCDVEEPNCHLFLHPKILNSTEVTIMMPQIDPSKCNGCGECGRFCEFNAIASFGIKPLVFPEMCHGCGGCAKVCPQEAITEVARGIGVIEEGQAGAVSFVHGRLNIKEPMAPPIIKAVKTHALKDGLTIIDAPPGTSCPAIATMRECDFVVLVTEPTPFGLNDLILAVETVRQLGVPFGVVINRADAGDNRVLEYCQTEEIPILLAIPYDRRIAEAYSEGQMIVEAVPGLRDLFLELHTTLGSGTFITKECNESGKREDLK
jgi:MinD superfamily P-loop ATPase